MRKGQSGASLLEVMGALAVGTVMLVGLTTIVSSSLDDAKAQQTALYQNQLAKAVIQWVGGAANRQSIIDTATTTTPRKITLAELAPFLPPSYASANPFMQTPCAMAYFDSGTGRIEVALTTEGGTAIDDAQLGYIVAHGGTGAGAIYSSDPNTARGAFGGWQAPVASYTTTDATRRCGPDPATEGRLLSLLPFDQAGLYALTGAGEWLARNEIPGRPELNRMNTTLDMGNNRVAGLQEIYDTTSTACTVALEDALGRSVSGLTQRCTSGVWSLSAGCGPSVDTGDLARGPGGELLSCQAGLWRTQGSAYWQDPVLDASVLPGCDATGLGQTRVVMDAADGAGRPRAYTCNGATWQPLALDNDGNLYVPGTLAVEDLATFNGNVQVGDTSVGAAGSGAATGTIAMGTAEIKLIVTEGSACGSHPNGTIARDTAGLLLSCQSGVWRPSMSLGRGLVCLRYQCYGGCSMPGWVLEYHQTLPSGFSLLSESTTSLGLFANVCLPN